MQTSVNAGGQAVGVAGMIADSGDLDTLSGFNKDTVQIPFGYGVRFKPGGNPGEMLIATGFSNVGGAIVGINAYGLNHARAGSADASGYYHGDMGASGLLPNAAMVVARRGRVLVPVEAAVRVGDRPYCRGIPTGNLTAGVWAGSGYGASYHIDCTAQGQFVTASYTAADGSTLVAVLDCDFNAKPA